MSMRLLTIETRRTIGQWVMPIGIAVAGKFAYDNLHATDVVLWATSSKVARDSLFVIGPFTASVAAWVAGREEQRGLGDLLATTPRPELQRRILAWTATVLWSVLAYLAVGALVVLDSTLRSAWGTPTMWPVLTGLLAVLAHAALGYAFGYHWPSRFTAPLVGIIIFAVQTFVADQGGSSWGQWLSPIARIQASVWYGVQPYLGMAQTLFLLGLTGLAWGSVAVRSRKRHTGVTVILGAALLTGAGVRETYRNRFVHDLHSQRKLVHTDRPQAIPYTPVCRDVPLPVCVHPAYRSQLPEVAMLLSRMTAPLSGVPGAPTKAEQRPFPAESDVLTFDLRGSIGPLTAYTMALKLIRDDRLPSHAPGDAQAALQVWLMERVGTTVTCVDGAPQPSEFVTFTYDRRICDAARRFAALDPALQYAWLTEQYANLRADTLRLEDLP